MLNMTFIERRSSIGPAMPAAPKTLGGAFRAFRSNRSPWLIGGATIAVAGGRVALGGLTWRDGAAAAFMVVVYPFGEWAIHVHLLHLRPFRLRGRRVELATARAHREHHERPNHLGLILLGPIEAAGLLFLAVPTAVGLLAGLVALLGGPPPVGPLVTAVLTGYALVFTYEWTHFLIHTAYRPRSRYYRSIWHTHRLHHFKNEHYWHGITNTVGDRVFGTNPDQRDVPRSRTARTLRPD